MSNAHSTPTGRALVVRLVTAEAGEVVTRFYRDHLPALAKAHRVTRCGGHLLDLSAAAVDPWQALAEPPDLDPAAWRPLAGGGAR